MYMLKNIFTFLLTNLVCTISIAAGGMEGGGGKGVFCDNGTIQTLDLYEAREVHKFSIPRSNRSLDENLKSYGINLSYYLSETGFDLSNESYKDLILNEINRSVVQRFVDIPMGTRLPFTPDASLPSLNPGCSFVQIALYSDDGNIYRDREYWDLLSSQEQSALVLHEGMYRQARLAGLKTSDDIRYIIGLMYANRLPAPIFFPVWNKAGAFWCATVQNQIEEDFEFYAVDESLNGVQGVSIYFSTFKNYFQYERVSAFIPHISIRDLYLGKESFRAFASSNITHRDWQFEYQAFYKNGYTSKVRAWKTGSSKPQFSELSCQLRLKP